MSRRGFYDRPIHERLAVKIVDGLLSAGVVYLLSPYLMNVLGPIQASINAQAMNRGAIPPTQGANAVANTLIHIVGS